MLLVGHQWPSITAAEMTASAAANRSAIAEAFDAYADTIRSVRTGPLGPQEGVTAEDTRESFVNGENHARETSSKNVAKSNAYKVAGDAVNALREDLATIAAEGNSAIREIQTSKKPVPVQLAEIRGVVSKSQGKANIKAADHSANLLSSINKVLNDQGVTVSAQEFAKRNGVDLARAFRAPNDESVRQSVTAMRNQLKTPPPAGTSPSAANNFASGQDSLPVPSQVSSDVPSGHGASVSGQDNVVTQVRATPAASAPSAKETTSVGQDTFAGPTAHPTVATSSPPSIAGGGQSSSPSTSLAESAPSLSTTQPAAPSTSAPTNALSPEGFAQNFTSGAQAGNPVSAGTEGLSNSAAHAMQPQVPIHPESMAAPPMPSTTPTAGVPLFETAHPATTFDTTQAPAAPAPDGTQTYVAGPAAQAPVMPSTASLAAPAGPLPAYGADLRPAAATAPASPAPMPSAAAPASAPVHPSNASPLNQPAVVRQAPTPTAPVAQAPTGLTESAVAATGTGTGTVAGASAAQTQAQQRLQRLLDAVARQEPQLRWTIGDREDGTTVLTTDLASGWIPPHIEIPTGIKLLTPRVRSRTLEALLGGTALTASYTPGQYLPPAEDAEPMSMSIRARDTHKVDELGWELAQATKWRDGLPRLAHTLAKAASTGTGYLDSEVELLREHLATVAHQVLTDYPAHSDAAKVGNWQLLATIDALIKNEKTAANYHFAWFQALSLALKGEVHP
jgi:hypothetical protein